jgi:hypothetical protein
LCFALVNGENSCPEEPRALCTEPEAAEEEEDMFAGRLQETLFEREELQILHVLMVSEAVTAGHMHSEFSAYTRLLMEQEEEEPIV